MSADRAVLTEINLEDGSATLETEISIDDLFENDEWRLLEDADGWVGFEQAERNGDVVYYYRDTRLEADNWVDRIRVGERSILEAARERLVEVDFLDTVREGSA